MARLTRRSFALAAGAAACGAAPPAARGARPPSYASELPDMLLAHLAAGLNALAARWDKEREAIRTAQDVERRNRFVREKFRELTGPYPEPNSLEAVTVRGFRRNGYRVENVMFQSRPDFWVTGNLYVPESGPGPFPGIIAPCGHSEIGRAHV